MKTSFDHLDAVPDSFRRSGACAATEPDALPGSAHDLEEVVVTGTRSETDIRHLPMTVSVVDRRRIEQSNMPSLLPILSERIPGLFSTGRGIMGYGVSGGAAGQMSLRGIGGPAQSGVPTTGMLVLIDGHPQYMGLFGHPISDAYQSLMAERVEVLRGPASVLYGSNAMGGVVNIVTRKMREDGVKNYLHTGYGSYNTLQSELTNRIRKGRFTSVVSGSYNRTDGHRANMGFEQYGGYAKLGYEISDHWNAWADVNVTHFNASNPGETFDPLIDNDQRITRGMTSLALENRYAKTSGTLSFSIIGENIGSTTGTIPTSSRWTIASFARRYAGPVVVSERPAVRGKSPDGGCGYFRFGGEAWNQPVGGGDREMQADKIQHETAGYVDFRQSLTRWLTFDAGLRLDHHSHVGTEWVPQAGLSFVLPRRALLKFSAAKGFRYPTIRELYMFPPANPDLKPERLWSYELSFSQQPFGGRLSYGVNVFLIDGENLIVRMPVDGRPMNVNTGRIRNAGVEFEASCLVSRSWSLDANYSYLHMQRPVLASPEHKLYAGATFSKGRWNVSSGVQYVADLYTEVKLGDTGDSATENFVLWNVRGSFRAA
ncbi:MAG: TonB-dependent receptor plug domain-containing protein, partial [Alistipes ihumii]